MAEAKTDEPVKVSDETITYPEMEFRRLPGTGLMCSVFGFGTMSFNDEEQATGMMRAAREIGINFFDNAELYGEPLGNAEILFGKALKTLQAEDPVKWRRSDLVITTKLFFGPNPTLTSNEWGIEYGKNELGTSRKHLQEGIAASLERMQLDYVDVLYAHRYDSTTPMLETVRAFTQIIRDGKAHYWGTSMWPPEKLVEAYWVAKINGLIAPVVEQPQYSMLVRKYVEDTYTEVFKAPYRMGTTVWSPLNSGVLTGKYLDGIPDDSRLKGDRLSKWFGYMASSIEEKNAIVRELKKWTDARGCSLVDIALAWVIKNKDVTVCMLGASRPSQLLKNAAALELARTLTEDDLKEIEAILKNKPKKDFSIYGSMARASSESIKGVNFSTL